jgi:predicted transcriptional regulator of viral defense system
MEEAKPARPDWNRLFEIAAGQEGYFTTQQAAEAGYSPQLLVHYVHTGRATRSRRKIYRLVHFPAGEHEDLIPVWLWSDRAGVVSHQTAMALLGLSDVLPAHVHLTLPNDWKRRRLRVPDDVVLHFADVPHDDRTWFGAVPTTNARRSLNDCADQGMSPELLRQAALQALRRGLVMRPELGPVDRVLTPFGGLSA